MALHARIDDLEGIPEELRDEYEAAEGGGFQLKVLKGFVPQDQVEDVSGLKSALHKERDNVREIQGKLKAQSERYAGFDLEEYERLKQQERDAEAAKLEQKGEWDKRQQMLVDEHQKELDKERAKSARLLQRIEKTTIDAQITQALSDAGGNVKLLTPHVRSLVAMQETADGDYIPVVTMGDGKTPRVKADGTSFTIADLVAEMREQDDFAAAFKGTGKSGSGTLPGEGGQGTGVNGGAGGGRPPLGQKPFSDASREERIEFLKRHGRVKFKEWEAQSYPDQSASGVVA